VGQLVERARNERNVIPWKPGSQVTRAPGFRKPLHRYRLAVGLAAMVCTVTLIAAW
jgi:hypothetical protein